MGEDGIQLRGEHTASGIQVSFEWERWKKGTVYIQKETLAMTVVITVSVVVEAGIEPMCQMLYTNDLI